MAPSREIEKLQRRWQENTLGLTFAPLAEAYRKEGMFADALDLLEIGLSRHPNYVPAHIVRARCYLDVSADGDAERSFLRVNDLDPENVIALKGLAEIAERAGRSGEAIARLERLLEFDRSNEDAQAQLERLRGSAPPAAAPLVEAAPLSTWMEPVPAVSPEPPADPPRAAIVETTEVEVVAYNPVELVSAQAPEYQAPNDAATLEPEVARGGVGADLGEEAEAGATPEPGTEIHPPDFGSTMAGAEEVAWQPETVAEIAPISEPVVDSSVDRFVDELAALPETAEVVVDAVPDDEGAAVAEPELVVTETMAELFLRQGHRALALAVYTQLATRDPGNQRIRDAIAGLEAELKPASASGIPVFAAVLTGGQSVRSFFEQLLAAQRPGAPAPDPGLSLGAVFGEERGTPPAPTGGERDPSFDEFYGDSEPALPSVPISPPPVEAARPGDDLEGFTDWLKGLKR